MKELIFNSIYKVQRMDKKLSFTVYSPYEFINDSDEFIGENVIIDKKKYKVIGFETNHYKNENVTIREDEMINLFVEE